MAENILPDAKVRTATFERDGHYLRDGGGLRIRLKPATKAGARGARLAEYHFKLKTGASYRNAALHLGTIGEPFTDDAGKVRSFTLSDARRARDAARLLVADGIDPRVHRRAERIERQAEVAAVIAEAERERAANRTPRDLFEAWIADGVARKDGNAELRRTFEKDVLPALGDKPLREVTEHDLRSVLRAVVARGAHRTAVRLRNDLMQMFKWGERRKPWRPLMAEGNPMLLVEIEKIIPSDVDIDGERTRVLSPEEIRKLRDIFATMEAAYEAAAKKYEAIRPLRKESQIALWISLATTCRMGELLMAEWKHLDLERGEWFIPKENAKGARGKKQDQLVFLSDFALRQFKALQALTGSSEWCFPARNKKGEDTHVCPKSLGKQVGDRQEQFKDRTKRLRNRQQNNTLVLAGGANGDWVPHDMRRTAATWMQALRISPDVIDRCQNHVMKGNRVRRHYLHHDYADEKREAWRLLGERIEAVLAENVVILSARGAA